VGESTSSFKIKQKIQSIRLCARTVDFHCRRTLSLYNSTRSTSVQGDHFHSVYFAAGIAWASG